MRIQPKSQDTEPSYSRSHGQSTYTSRYRVLIELGSLIVIVLIPISVHAGVLATFVGMWQEDVPQKLVYADTKNAQNVSLLKAAYHADPNPAKGGGDVMVEDGALVPSHSVSDDEESVNSKTANGEISVYIVREADTLSQIAEMFDVSANTILWANDIKKASLIRPGDTLVILPITGVRHVVKDGDTIATIAKKYEGDVDDILSYNQLASADSISVGDTVVIPGGAVAAPAPVKSATPVRTSGGTAVATGNGSSGFIHPLPGGLKSQGIHGYNGVDIAASYGSAVRAAATGDVIVSKSTGWNGGYGQYVVVKHDNGTQTLYAHLSSNAVSVGQRVAAGTTIGGVGSTGRSTGNHLHFEVRGARNPF